MLRDEAALKFSALIAKPILRLGSAQEFQAVPEILRAEICRTVGVSSWNEENFDIRIISEDENYAQHYMRRVQAVNAGAQFLLNALTTNDEPDKFLELQKTLNDLTQKCCDYLRDLNSTNINHYQNSLVHYSEVLLTLMSVRTGKAHHALEELIDRAEQFATANTTRPAVCTIGHGSDPATASDFIAQIDVPENPFTLAIIKELSAIKHTNEKKIPEWFKQLNKHDQLLLKHFLSLHDEGEFGPIINVISSKLRIIPVPANYGRHTLMTCTKHNDDDAFQLTTYTPEFRSSHVASRDIESKHKDIRYTHAYNNLKKEIEDAIEVEKQRRKSLPDQHIPKTEIVIPILYQTLITPFKNPDASLNTDRIQAVEEIIYELNTRNARHDEENISFALFSTNHPLNYGKFIDPTTSWGSEHSTGASITNLLYVLRGQLGEDTSLEAIRLKKLLDTLEERTMKWWSTEGYRELFLSSLEQLIVSEFGGISIGSCVSGKDRKAVEIIHTDALKIYYHRYQKLPPLTAETADDKADMEVFARIFADIYCTKHQMLLADFNAPGSFGIKTPSMYLPKHLQDAVLNWYTVMADTDPIYAVAYKKNLMKESDIMASNNEIEKFKSRSLSSSQTDPSWTSSTLYFSDEDSTKFMITMAKTAARYYIDTRSERIGFFARTSGSEAGSHRANVCIQLLEDSEVSPFHKILFIHALLTSNLGENLITDIVEKLGFDSLDTAKETLSEYNALAASHAGFDDTRPLQKCEEQIIAQLKSLSQKTQINGCLINIKGEFAKLQPPQKKSSLDI